MINKWVKKPVVIEAIQWTGNNNGEIKEFMTSDLSVEFNGELLIDTLEGIMRASVGDFIIKGVKGEFYPCKPDIFYATYERHLTWDENL